MSYSTRIILDSISPAGRRLTTWELTYPRFVHAELMTHRLFSRNSASSRAIPVEKMLRQIELDPALPVFWGANQKGMQAAEELSDRPSGVHQYDGTGVCMRCSHDSLSSGSAPCSFDDSPLARVKKIWLRLRDQAVAGAREMAELGLHKQLCNRPTEPWMFITVIVSATTFDNWFHLRDHWQAQPEIAWVAKDMHAKAEQNKPQQLRVGEWHMPFIEPEDCVRALGMTGGRHGDATNVLKQVSTGRVARVSLLNHEGKRDLHADVDLHNKLLAGQASGDPLHMSPFEHVAQCLEDPNQQSGNFRGWAQYRKEIPNEHFGEVLP